MNDRRRIVEGWVWMMTFHAAVARNFSVQGAALIADEARAEVWRDRRTTSPQNTRGNPAT